MNTPEQTQAACDAMLARVEAMFDETMAVARRIQCQMVADGLIREPGSRTRDGEAA